MSRLPLFVSLILPLSPSISLFLCICFVFCWCRLSLVVKAMAGTRFVKFQTTVTFCPWFAPLKQTQPVLHVISKPLFGEASLSEQWENIQCISIGRLWFLFVLHLLCLAIVHRNDSKVHGINSQTTWFLLDFVGIQSLNVKHESHFSFCLPLSPFLY